MDGECYDPEWQASLGIDLITSSLTGPTNPALSARSSRCQHGSSISDMTPLFQSQSLPHSMYYHCVTILSVRKTSGSVPSTHLVNSSEVCLPRSSLTPMVVESPCSSAGSVCSYRLPSSFGAQVSGSSSLPESSREFPLVSSCSAIRLVRFQSASAHTLNVTKRSPDLRGRGRCQGGPRIRLIFQLDDWQFLWSSRSESIHCHSSETA